MYKTFTLAMAVSLLPVSKQIPASGFARANYIFSPAHVFPYKNTITINLFEPEKKPAEPWSQNWMATAQENIRKSEYHFTWEEKLHAYCTPNRKNNLRFFYTEKGFTIEPRTTKIPIGDFDPMAMAHVIKYKILPNWKINFNLDKKQLGKGFWKVTANKAEYITDNITVQYINNDDGMRQNFIVHQPLSKVDELKINFNIKTKLKNKLSQNQLQFFHKKINVLNYKDLKVWDATGKSLKASFKKRKNANYYIQVDTKEAVYPVTIDPISTTPASVLESNQVNANLGYSVASAGDVNGDGYSDVIAGAINFDNGHIDEGAAFVYHGSATGVGTTAAAVVESNVNNGRLGTSVSTAGDVNGDGYSDIIVGAGTYSNGETTEGAAFIYHGSATGINTTAAIRLESNQASAQMGASNSVACAGDVNNDGYSDVIVGAWLYDNGETNEGVAFVYHGSASGITGTIATTLEANQAAANFGLAVAGAGDVNGDGYSDVIVGAEDYDSGETDEGVIFIYHGSGGGINNVAVTMAESNQSLSQYGYAVASAGDVNGDGYSDVVVGAYTFDNGETNEGATFIYLGSAAGIINAISATLQSDQIGAQLGLSVSGAGDINGDGYSDVIAGANLYDNVETSEGAAFVYFGSSSGTNTTATILESNQANAQMGRGVGAAGDVNGDGYSDVIVGANFYMNVQSGEGAAFVFHGSPSGINTTAAATVESNQAGAYMGVSVASAGDVNGDGYSDVIVGASAYDNGQADEGAAFVYHGSPTGINTTAAAMVESNQTAAYMGVSVASAGDVNGDGYSDVIVGASAYDNGQDDEGLAFVYHGSPTGINTTPAATVESNQADALMGFPVASAGDVNGDGYSDVIVGAQYYDNGQANEGAAFVHHGSPTGINTTAAATVESNQASAYMGISVASAGDVNGDGYSDVIVGAWFYDNGQVDEGRAFVYHGSPAGIGITAVATIESNQAGALMGVSVSSAGDVNGDGYSDVIVGAYAYDNGQADEGAAFVYHGSPTGINTTAAATIESNQANALMGISVSSAGDVNGDGYSDVIVGAYVYDNGQADEGRAFVYHGNSPGTNKRNNLRLYNTNLTTPINSSNFLFGNFGAGLYTKSFLGKIKGKMVWETRLSYNPYSGTPITNSTFFTSQQVSYTDLGLAGVELKNLIDKLLGSGRYTKLRARIKYDPVTAITGQVYGPWRNVSAIIDGNSLGALPIELISFNAAWLQKGKTAKINFTTDKESGICCFDILKSLDGFNFYSIGTRAAKNISGIQSYSFIDNNAINKKQFYRLKIKGSNGQVDYSNIQQLQNNGSTEILVFPNPTTDVLQLQLNGAYDKMNVQIINSAGQLVKQMQITSANQTIPIAIGIPVQNLAAGKYWLHLQSGNEKQVLQFVKQ